MTAAPDDWVGEEGEDGARGADVVCVVKVEGRGVVEIDGSFDEAEGQELGVEPPVLGGIFREGRDMVDALNDGWHGGDSGRGAWVCR